MNTLDIKKEIIELIEATSRNCLDPLISEKDFYVDIQLKGRKKDNALPENKIAVYLFFLGNECLKVGQAGRDSGPRFQDHHYNPESSKSNLASSVLNDKTIPSLDETNIKSWLKENTDRLDVIIDARSSKHLDKIVLNFIEGLLQYKFKPRYEGRR